MANHKSALKRIRQNGKRRLRNRWHRGLVRAQVKTFRTAVEAGDVETAHTEMQKAIALVDHTRSRGVMHKNTASRKVSRLMLAYNKLVATQSAPAAEA